MLLDRSAALSLERDPQLQKELRHVDVVGRATLDVGDAAVLAALPQVVLAQARCPAGIGNLLERGFYSEHINSPPLLTA